MLILELFVVEGAAPPKALFPSCVQLHTLKCFHICDLLSQNERKVARSYTEI